MPIMRKLLIIYTLSWTNPQSHTFNISIESPTTGSEYTDFQLPRWRPGRYILQDYAAAVSNFAAEAGDEPLRFEKLESSRWRVYHPGYEGTIRVSYDYFADVMDAGSSGLNDEMAYINPVNCMMYVPDYIDEAVELHVPSLTDEMKIASQLEPVDGERNHFRAESFHDLADSPTIFSENITQFEFKDGDVNYRLHFAGNYGASPGDEQALIDMLGPTIREQAAIFGGVPDEIETYDFIYLLVPFFYRHAVEHKNSSMYVLPEGVAKDADAFRGLIGISSHEFWHTWNVKRLRPKAMVPYDYAEPQHTTLHWLTEGVTDYYAYLTLCRAGVYSQEEFFNYCSRIMTSLENNYAQGVISPSQSSMDSWLATSPYQPDHLRISYYTLGSRLGLLLDIQLRKLTDGQFSMDDVFHDLYKNHYLEGHGYEEEDVLNAMNALLEKAYDPKDDPFDLGPGSMDDFYAAYIDGTQSIAYEDIFAKTGLEVKVDTSAKSWSDWLGITRLQEVPDGNGQLIRSVHHESDAAKAGLQPRDVVLTVNGFDVNEASVNDEIDLRKDAELVVSYTRNGGERETTITLTGDYLPLTYTLQATDDGLAPISQKWLESRAK